jgi:hypothetical protein
MSDNQKIEDKPKSDQQKAQEFVKAYEALCDTHQMRVVATPVYKARDDGTYSLIVNMSVGKLPQSQ